MDKKQALAAYLEAQGMNQPERAADDILDRALHFEMYGPCSVIWGAEALCRWHAERLAGYGMLTPAARDLLIAEAEVASGQEALLLARMLEGLEALSEHVPESPQLAHNRSRLSQLAT
jgi:hypothetical protein